MFYPQNKSAEEFITLVKLVYCWIITSIIT